MVYIHILLLKQINPEFYQSSVTTFLSSKSHLIIKRCQSLFFLQGKGAAGPSGKSSTDQEKRQSEPKQSPGDKRPMKDGKSKGGRGGKKAKRGVEMKADEEKEEKNPTSAGQRPKNAQRRSIASKVTYKEESGSEADEKAGSDDDFQVTSEEENSVDSENEAKSTKTAAGKRKSKSDRTKNNDAQKRRGSGGKWKQDSQELEEKKETAEGGGEPTIGNGAKRRSGRKKQGPGADEWLEVHLTKTSSWVCVDVDHGVGKPHLCSQNATLPMTYVVSVDGDGFVKDLGRKYDPTWMTLSRKRRVDEDWWDETLTPFMGPEDEKDKKEDKEVH